MLDRFITAMTDLPIIAQGALGSALFAVLMFMGQRIVAWASSRWSRLSKARRRVFLIDETVRYQVLAQESVADKSAFLLLLLYRGSQSLVRALVWLVFGLLFGSLESVLGVVGYLGSVYYLFRCLNTIAYPEPGADAKAKIAALEAQLKSLGDA